MKRVLFALFPLILYLGGCGFTEPMAKDIQEKSSQAEISVVSEKDIGRMLMIGFFGTSAKRDSDICKTIRRYDLGGVILFDKDPTDAKRAKNIRTPQQLATLVRELQACSERGDLLIAVDQEGGLVQRLKAEYGFYGNFPKASEVAKRGEAYAEKIYAAMAGELSVAGIDINLAPVVDLAINPKNRVIYALGRSYGKDPRVVARYASIFIRKMHEKGVLTSLKHFPGHGSSLGDTHKGFVDVSRQWREEELSVYRILFAQSSVDSVMVAHIFNKKLDEKYPASLSYKIVTGLLRERMGYDGVVISDDLQMNAIRRHYSLKDTLRLAINAGDDILLFANQLPRKDMLTAGRIVGEIEELVREGKIDAKKIAQANARVMRLKRRVEKLYTHGR